jgi:hypothetical protein
MVFSLLSQILLFFSFTVIFSAQRLDEGGPAPGQQPILQHRLVVSQPPHVIADLLQSLFAGPRASPGGRIGGKEGLHLCQLPGRGEVGRQLLGHASQVAVVQAKPGSRE